MSKITISRTRQELPAEPVLAGVREFLFGVVDGFGQQDKSAWRRFWKRIARAEAGEMFQVEAVAPRNGKFHRKFFALLTVGFDAWEPDRMRKSYKGMPVEKNFEQFREDITILAGYYTQTFDLKGRLVLRAKSISFAAMDDTEFEALYSAVVDVLLARVCTQYAGRAELDRVVEQVIGFA